MKKSKKSIIVMIALSSFILSCENNIVYFNLDTQILKRCNNKGLKHIEIINDSLKVYYSVDWVKNQPIPTEINLNKINDGYKITLNGVKIIQNQNFTLESNKHYKIVHRSNGDANSSEINVYLIDKMKIVSADKTNCE